MSTVSSSSPSDPSALPVPELPSPDGAHPVSAAQEREHARRLAERYRLEFVDMDAFHLDNELFRSIPADVMLRYGFVPHRRDADALVIVVSDPTDLMLIDELSQLLGTRLKVTVGPASAIQAMLKKSESSCDSSSISIRSVGSDTTITSASASRRCGTKP